MAFKVVFTDYNFSSIDIERQVLSELDCDIVELQTKDEQTLITQCYDADGLIVQYAPITSRVIEATTNAKVISRYGVGVDIIDIEAATNKKILVCNVPDYCMDEMADHTLALILALGRKIVPLAQSVEDRKWDAIGVSKPLYSFKNQTLGLVGFGKIPQNLYPKALNLFSKILVYDPYLKKDTRDKYNLTSVSFHEMVRTCDYISIHCPLIEETYHMFSESQFQLMKPNTYLINTSRGPIVDTKALYLALRNGHLAGAALDVLEEEPPGMECELIMLDSVIITPHAAFYSESSLRDLKYKTALNVVKVLGGEKPINVLNRKVLG